MKGLPKELIESIKIINSASPREVNNLLSFLKERIDNGLVNLIMLKDYADIRYTQGYVKALTDISTIFTHPEELGRDVQDLNTKSTIGGV